MVKVLGVAVIFAVVGGLLVWDRGDNRLANPSPQTLEVKSRPLDKYTIEALARTNFEASEITFGKVLEERDDSTSYIFYFWADGKRVSGLANIPNSSGEYPVLIMFRGYVDKEIYTTGTGTQRAGEVFAKNGFVTLAPDFLGYGESDKPSDNPIEERFQTYVTALTLLESIKNLNETFSLNNQEFKNCHSESSGESLPAGRQVDPSRPIDDQDDKKCANLTNIAAGANSHKVGIWGHSNGGQIALTVLEITGRSIPTVLWAPVSKPFPYSVLYYTDAAEDRGKLLRRVIADFEKDYNVELYNLTNYFDKINAPLSIHQGSSDDSVPQKWSDELVGELEKLGKGVEYFVYPGADHNLLPSGWGTAVNRAIIFYSERKNYGIHAGDEANFERRSDSHGL